MLIPYIVKYALLQMCLSYKSVPLLEYLIIKIAY